MNKAFLVIWIPAFGTTFYWMYEGYSLRVAIFGTIAELALAAGVILYLRRRQQQKQAGAAGVGTARQS